MEPKVAFLDNHPRPGCRHQLLLDHHLPGTSNQQFEQVHRATADIHGNAVALEPSFRDGEPEGAETDGCRGGSGAFQDASLRLAVGRIGCAVNRAADCTVAGH